MEKIIFTYGLPGSGKTTWATQYYNLNLKKHGQYIDIDKYIKESPYSGSDLEKYHKVLHHDVNYYYDTLILDGLFLQNKNIVSTLEHLNKDELDNCIIEIHCWDENKQACLWNDKYRREVNSNMSIENMSLEPINIDFLSDKLKKYNCKLELIKHTTKYKSKTQLFIEKYSINTNNDNEFVSKSWKLGGRWWSYTGASGNIEPEQPLEFKEFDDLLLQINPSISFSQYKEIVSECVTIKEKNIQDYYSEGYMAFHHCDLDKLVNILEDMDLIDFND